MVLLSSSSGKGSSGKIQALQGMAKGKWESQRERAAGIGEQSSPHPPCASKIVRKSGISPGNSLAGTDGGCWCSVGFMLGRPLPPLSPTLPWHCQGHRVPKCHIQGVLGCPTLPKADKHPARAAQTAPGLREFMAQQPLESSDPTRADFGASTAPGLC